MSQASMLATLKMSIVKPGTSRNYEDLLTIKSYMYTIDFFKELFGSLSFLQIDELCRSFCYESFNSGQLVFAQHSPGDKFYVIIEGSCDISKKVLVAGTVDEYEDRVVHTCRQGQYFGERALQHDEPRAASVRANEMTEALSLSKEVYEEIIKHYTADLKNDIMDKSSKAYTLRVLMKRKDFRTPDELRDVANYLDRRIEFFRKFNRSQQVELSRVAELIQVQAHTTLFKEGQIGRAFYIILSGKADFFKISEAEESKQILINTIGPGGAFGERALDSASSLRAATVIISEASDLLVISKRDYDSIFTEMKAREKKEKLDILKLSHNFQSLSNQTSNEVIRFMERRTYKLDQIVYSPQTKATEIVFVSKGEFMIEVEIEESKGRRFNVPLGRVGPATVLADYITQCTSYIQEMSYKERVVAMGICSVFILNKYDLFFNLSVESRLEMAKLVMEGYLNPPATSLFDNVPKKFGEKDWRVYKSWKIFRKDLPHSLDLAITETFRQVQEKTFLVSGADGNVPSIRCDKEIAATSASLKSKHEKLARFAKKFDENSEMLLKASMEDSYQNESLIPAVRGAVLRREGADLNHSDCSMSNAFLLIQYHKDCLIRKSTHLVPKKRYTKLYMQICGAFESSELAQSAADTFILNVKILLPHFDMHKLQWNVFMGFDAVPTQHSDHFIVYCRSAPILIASYSPNLNVLEVSYPEMCRSKGQAYACILFSRLGENITEDDSSSSLVIVKELQAFVEIQNVMSSRLDSLRYAKVVGISEMAQRVNCESLVCCIFPLYNWLPISDETFSKFDCTIFSESNLTASPTRLHSKDEPVLDENTSVKDTFARAKVNSNDQKVNFKSNPAESMITTSLTLRMLDQEVARKKLSLEVIQKKHMINTVGIDDFEQMQRLSSEFSTYSQISDDSADSSTKKIIEPLSSQLSSLKAVIGARRELIQKNDYLCMTEKFIREKYKSSREKNKKNEDTSFRSDDDLVEEDNELSVDFAVDKDIKYALALSKSRPKDPLIMARALSKQHFEMLSTLSAKTSLKNIKGSQSNVKKKNPYQLASASMTAVVQPDSSLRKHSSTSLSARLEVLEELLQNSRANIKPPSP